MTMVSIVAMEQRRQQQMTRPGRPDHWLASEAGRTDPGSEAWSLLHWVMISSKQRFMAMGREFDLAPQQVIALRDPRRRPAADGRAGHATSRCDSSNVTGITDRLEERGLVRREPGDERPPRQDASSSPTRASELRAEDHRAPGRAAPVHRRPAPRRTRSRSTTSSPPAPLGCERIVVVEPQESRRERIAALGFDALDLDGVHVAALEALGGQPPAVGWRVRRPRPDHARARARAGRPGGDDRRRRRARGAGPDQPAPADPAGRRASGAFAYRREDFERAIELIASGEVPAGELVTEVAPMTPGQELFDELRAPGPISSRCC